MSLIPRLGSGWLDLAQGGIQGIDVASAALGVPNAGHHLRPAIATDSPFPRGHRLLTDYSLSEMQRSVPRAPPNVSTAFRQLSDFKTSRSRHREHVASFVLL